MHDSDAEESFPLAKICEIVEEALPWVSRLDGRPFGMQILFAGFLEWDHPLHISGTPYVAVGVEDWEAATRLQTALDPIARLDEASWTLDWESCSKAFRMIRVFPELPALE
jgi:hypothetical protein